MHGEHRDAVVVGQPPDGVDLLAHRVEEHHELDPVVAQPGGQLEGRGRRLGVGRRGGQRDPGAWDPHHLAHVDQRRRPVRTYGP